MDLSSKSCQYYFLLVIPTPNTNKVPVYSKALHSFSAKYVPIILSVVIHTRRRAHFVAVISCWRLATTIQIQIQMMLGWRKFRHHTSKFFCYIGGISI